MRYSGWLRDLIQKTRIFRRYILNVSLKCKETSPKNAHVHFNTN